MFHKVTFWIASIMYVFFNERVTKLDIMRHIFKVNLFHLYLSFLAMLYGYMFLKIKRLIRYISKQLGGSCFD